MFESGPPCEKSCFGLKENFRVEFCRLGWIRAQRFVEDQHVRRRKVVEKISHCFEAQVPPG